MIYESRKREKEQKKKRIDELADKKGDELFIMADNMDEAKEIFDVNDQGENMMLKQRIRQIRRQGKVKEADLIDVKMDLNRQAAAQSRDRRRK
jgi:hypothetical protein